MVDCFDGLRHHVVVSGNDDDTDVGYLSTACTHGGERLVTGGVEECYMAAVGQFYVVGADVLGYTASFPGDYVGFADIVEQRCLTVVNVPHHGYDRRT